MNVNAYGIDWDGPAPSEEWDRVVEDDSVIVWVPQTFCALDSQGVQALARQVDPAEPSMYYGVDIYLNALHSCNNGGMSECHWDRIKEIRCLKTTLFVRYKL